MAGQSSHRSRGLTPPVPMSPTYRSHSVQHEPKSHTIRRWLVQFRFMLDVVARPDWSVATRSGSSLISSMPHRTDAGVNSSKLSYHPGNSFADWKDSGVVRS